MKPFQFIALWLHVSKFTTYKCVFSISIKNLWWFILLWANRIFGIRFSLLHINAHFKFYIKEKETQPVIRMMLE